MARGRGGGGGNRGRGGGGGGERGGGGARGANGGGGGRGGPRGRGRGGRGGGGRGGSLGASMLAEEAEFLERMFNMNGRGANFTPPQRSSGFASPSTPNNGNNGRGRGKGSDANRSKDSLYSSPRGGGRGQGEATTATRRRGSYGIGASGRGRNNGYSTPDRNGPLSNLLQLDRPLLRPVIFVPSVYSRLLFAGEDGEDDEELMKPAVEDVPEDSTEYKEHAPTADRVFRVFSGGLGPPPLPIPGDSSGEGEDGAAEEEEGIEEIDFNDLGRLVESLGKDGAKAPRSKTSFTIVEEQFTGLYIRAAVVPPADDAIQEEVQEDIMEEAALTREQETENTQTRLVSVSEDVVMSSPLPSKADLELMATDNTTTTPNTASIATADTHPATTLASFTPDTAQASEPIASPAESGDPAESEYLTSPIRVPADTAFAPEPSLLPPSIGVEVEAEVEVEVEVTAEEEEGAFFLEETAAAAPPLSFVIDTEPDPVGVRHALKPRIATPPPMIDDDDEVIVYVAPHPRQSERGGGDVEEEHRRRRLREQEREQELFTPYERPGGFPVVASVGVPAPAPEAEAEAALPASDAQTLALNAISFAFSRTSSSAVAAVGAATTATVTAATPSRRLEVPPVSTPRMSKAALAKQRKLVRRAKQKEKQKGNRSKKFGGGGGFGAFGAMMQERELREEYDGGGGGGRDSRWHERRRGDSDLDWGDGDDEEGGGAGDEGGDEETYLALAQLQETETVQTQMRDKGKGKAKDNGYGNAYGSGLEGMDVDPELELDVVAMSSFARGLLGPEAGKFVTADDLGDVEMMRREDEEEARNVERGSSGSEDEDEDDGGGEDEDEDVEAVVAREEALLIAESEDEDDDDEDEDEDDDDDGSDNEDGSPRTSFQARIARLREKSRQHQLEDDEDTDEDRKDYLTRNMDWAEEDDLLADIAELLDRNTEILEGRDRKARNKVFKAVVNGDFDEDDELYAGPSKKRKDKRGNLPPELQAQWDKDRAKKAAYKQQRELERFIRAADPFADKKGGKKGRKAVAAVAAARLNLDLDLDSTINVLPNRIIDISTLVQMIRRFVGDLGGKASMSLPPTEKETRKNVHELALAFGLRSGSKGKGAARYVTLTKTSRTTGVVDEGKVARIMRRAGVPGARGNEFWGGGGGGGGGRKGQRVVPRHREGEEVGKAAPKIGASNVGFRMLAMMGWSEGERIGVSGGLDAPVTAIIKLSKLGLGATK